MKCESFYALYFDESGKIINGLGLPVNYYIELPTNTYTIEFNETKDGCSNRVGYLTLDRSKMNNGMYIVLDTFADLENSYNAVNDTYYEYKLENDFVKKLIK